MDHRTAFNEWIMCSDAEVSVFAPFYGVLVPSNPPTSFYERKLPPFGCGVLTRLWVQTTGFGVCLWQSLYNSSGHLSNTERHRITIENLILDGQIYTLFSENKTMSELYCQR